MSLFLQLAGDGCGRIVQPSTKEDLSCSMRQAKPAGRQTSIQKLRVIFIRFTPIDGLPYWPKELHQPKMG